MEHYLGIDFGTKRIGLSFADYKLKVATPLKAIFFTKTINNINYINNIIIKKNIKRIVIGYPYHNSNCQLGWIYNKINNFIKLIKQFCPEYILIYKFDETLTSYQAQHDLNFHKLSFFKKNKQKKRIKKMGIIDSAAATILLQDFLNTQTVYSS